MSDDTAGMSEEDRMAAEWAAALDESKPKETASEVTDPLGAEQAAQFTNFASTPQGSIAPGNDLNRITMTSFRMYQWNFFL